jgi:hypothetical protein
MLLPRAMGDASYYFTGLAGRRTIKVLRVLRRALSVEL